MISNDIKSHGFLIEYKTRRKYYIYRESGNHLVNKSAFVIENIDTYIMIALSSKMITVS